MDIEAVKGVNPENGEEVTRKPDAKEPFAALAFKDHDRSVCGSPGLLPGLFR
jgi:hypothetical protein